MKKIELISILIFISGYLFSQTAVAPTAGSGTQGDPLQIATLENLYWISQNSTFWDQFYIQTADIDAAETATWFSGLGFTPIGTYSTSNFSGNYNGNGHVISNLTINRDIDGSALFSSISSTAEIYNLGLVNVSITISTQNGSYYDAAALVGWNNGGTITNCYSTGTITGDAYVGGLIGSHDTGGEVINCYSSCDIIGFETMGGLIGWSHSTVQNSYSTGNISGDNSIGGFIGYIASGNVNSCFSTGNVTANMWASGFTDANDGNITNCYSWGNVTRNNGSTDENFASFSEYAGNNTSIENCYATGAVIYENATNPTNKGFVITVGTNVTFTSNFFDYVTSGQISGIGATPKLTSQMQTMNTFTSAGWDFMAETLNGTNDYWGINSVDNNLYPFLKWQGYKLYPVISEWPVADNLECGQTLADVNLTGGNANISGSFEFANSALTPFYGTNNYELFFAPDDYTNYDTLYNNISLTVIDTYSPTINPINDDVVDADANCQAILLDYTGAATVYDECDGDLNVSQNPTAGTLISGATNSITITVTDDAGNSSEVSFNVAVEDNTNPTISCISNQTVDADQTNFYIVQGTEFDPVSTDDNCEVASIENDFNNTSTLENAQLPEGTTTIVWTITDIAGNTNTCNFVVTVNACVGVETLQQNGISIYPNPTNNFVTVTSEKLKLESISISDITGKQIINYQLSDFNSQLDIDLSSLKTGIYFIKISTKSAVFTHKLIKR